MVLLRFLGALGSWKDEDFEIAKASLRDQMYRLRGHPSMLTWLNGSDNPPPPDVEEMYLKIEADLRCRIRWCHRRRRERPR